MIKFTESLEFDWDEGNITKSFEKHEISPRDAEEAFTDSDALFYNDREHSELQDRYVVIGMSLKSRVLFIVFTVRLNKIRVISARTADKKERRLYEKIKENSAL